MGQHWSNRLNRPLEPSPGTVSGTVSTILIVSTISTVSTILWNRLNHLNHLNHLNLLNHPLEPSQYLLHAQCSLNALEVIFLVGTLTFNL